MKQGGHVYIVTNKPGGVLYIGVTANLVVRAAQHRAGTAGRFTSRYNCTRLVYVEDYPTIEEAIAREKAMKAWKRAWKVALIEEANPDWDDLYLQLNA